jgi:hypothetical protein
LSGVIVEGDEGHYDAVSKGFARSTGEIMGWLNSSDVLLPNSLSVVNEVFETFPSIEWLTSRVHCFMDQRGRLVQAGIHNGFEKESFLLGEHLPEYSKAVTMTFIMQECTFWRRSLWEKAGSRLDCHWRAAADFELWTRFFQHAELWSVSAPLGAFRRHPDQLSDASFSLYLREGAQILDRLGSRPQPPIKQAFRVKLRNSRLRRLAYAIGWLKPAPLCLYEPEKGWVQTRF